MNCFSNINLLNINLYILIIPCPSYSLIRFPVLTVFMADCVESHLSHYWRCLMCEVSRYFRSSLFVMCAQLTGGPVGFLSMHSHSINFLIEMSLDFNSLSFGQ